MYLNRYNIFYLNDIGIYRIAGNSENDIKEGIGDLPMAKVVLCLLTFAWRYAVV